MKFKQINVMKKTTSAFLMLALLATTVISCKKDDSTKIDNEQDLKSTKMTFKVDGTSKTSTHHFAVKDEETVEIYGSINDDEAVIMSIDELDGLGDYDLAEENILSYTSGDSPQADVYFAEEGTIKVTSSSNSEIKGTFSGTVKNLQGASKVITEGKFDAKIVADPS